MSARAAATEGACLTAHEVQGVLVLAISGRFTVLDRKVREVVNQSLVEGRRQFVLDLSEICYIDSCALGELISIYTSVRSLGGSVQLQTPSERVRKLLNITKLDTVFDILEDSTFPKPAKLA